MIQPGARRPGRALLALACLALAAPRAGRAQDPPPAAEAAAADRGRPDDERPDDEKTPAAEKKGEEVEEIVIRARAPEPPGSPTGAHSEVTRADLERRLPRSAPDALRFEPGVFVQQTAHGQGSAYIRGLTGQQTLLLFDGVRLNNSTYRQGPNQYFFTLDSQTIESLQVGRGGASTRWGSDAVGGVILARPIEPLVAAGTGGPFAVRPELRLRGATADSELGGRLQAELQAGPFGFLGGVGGRRVGLLQAGGQVRGLADGQPALVPRFAPDGRTQLGTGFDELTFDGRLVFAPAAGQAIKLAAYGYRQFDAPRTDQCPPAYAPHDECLRYDEQFRTLAYLVWQAGGLGSLADSLRATLSWQRQRERRSLDRPGAFVQNVGRDVVDTLGLTLAGRSRRFAPLPWLGLALDYGLDTYHDRLASAAWITFTDIAVTQRRSRGQYLDGSAYTYGGAFAAARLGLGPQVELDGGARLSWIAARAPGDPDSGSLAVDRAWLPLVGNVGLKVQALADLVVLAHYDRSFRAPNLDDLTSRQQTGPGFQFENAGLEPETADSFELGLQLRAPLLAEVWGFYTRLHGLMIKSIRQDPDCPPRTPACQASWNKLQLVNSPGDSVVWGLEGSLLAELPAGFEARAAVSFASGEGPDLSALPAGGEGPTGKQVPLSRIPPLNGSLEVIWRHRLGLSLGAALRWALAQDRLALADLADARIPRGGTPGFWVLDLRAAYRLADRLLVSLAVENLFDAAYRYHGSSVNGPGRGLVVMLDLGPLWRSAP